MGEIHDNRHPWYWNRNHRYDPVRFGPVNDADWLKLVRLPWHEPDIDCSGKVVGKGEVVWGSSQIRRQLYRSTETHWRQKRWRGIHCYVCNGGSNKLVSYFRTSEIITIGSRNLIIVNNSPNETTTKISSLFLVIHIISYKRVVCSRFCWSTACRVMSHPPEVQNTKYTIGRWIQNTKYTIHD